LDGFAQQLSIIVFLKMCDLALTDRYRVAALAAIVAGAAAMAVHAGT
jgi:hypothetical protein